MVYSYDLNMFSLDKKCLNFKDAEQRSVEIVLIPSDHIFEKILYSTDDKLKGARKELEDVVRRRLQKCVGETRITEDEAKAEGEVFEVSKILVFIEL